MTTPIGDVLAGLDMHTGLEPDELVAGAIVILKIVDADGTVCLRALWSDGLAVFERVGILKVALEMDVEDSLTGRQDDT